MACREVGGRAVADPIVSVALGCRRGAAGRQPLQIVVGEVACTRRLGDRKDVTDRVMGVGEALERRGADAVGDVSPTN